MQRSVYQHTVLDTIQASGLDIVVQNRQLYINGVSMWKFDDVRVNGIKKKTAVTSETLAKLTYTVPAVPANSTTYTVQFTVANNGATGAQSNPLVFNISVLTAATGTLANTDLVTQFKAVLANAPYTTYIAASGTTTLVLDAVAGYPVLIGGATAPITVAQTAQGIPKNGLPANMVALGVTPTPTGAAYTMYYCENFAAIGETNTRRFNQGVQQVLWLREAATNYATFITDFDNVLLGFLKDGTTINNHQLEVGAATASATQ